MNGKRETEELIKELKQAGFRVTPTKKRHYRVLPPLSCDEEGALMFMGSTPSDRRSLDNQRSWAEKRGLPKKHRN